MALNQIDKKFAVQLIDWLHSNSTFPFLHFFCSDFNSDIDNMITFFTVVSAMNNRQEFIIFIGIALLLVLYLKKDKEWDIYVNNEFDNEIQWIIWILIIFNYIKCCYWMSS
jgi:hypothetical protein